jgi:hypothetical protein
MLYSYQDERQLVIGFAAALFVACLHHPFAVTTRNGGGVPSSFLHEDPVSTATATKLLLHGELLTFDTDCVTRPQLRGPFSEERRVAWLASCSYFILSTVSAKERFTRKLKSIPKGTQFCFYWSKWKTKIFIQICPVESI